MKTLKKIHLKGVSETLSERELKRVLGGYNNDDRCIDGSERSCWIITCNNGDTFTTACAEGVVLCYDVGGCAEPCNN